jgi:hypothetical protein
MASYRMLRRVTHWGLHDSNGLQITTYANDRTICTRVHSGTADRLHILDVFRQLSAWDPDLH